MKGSFKYNVPKSDSAMKFCISKKVYAVHSNAIILGNIIRNYGFIMVIVGGSRQTLSSSSVDAEQAQMNR